jgi:hypothetical protein
MLLSELNPLQYIPVIGTIYRAVTGNVIPEPVRDAGSMLFSGLIAGPIGVATNAGALAAEKLTGLDPEKLGDKLLAEIGIHGEAPVKIEVAQEPAKPALPAPPKPDPAAAWSASQLAAYGVTTTTNGDLKLGALEGSDVLNTLELDRLQAQATAQYAATNASIS